MISKTGEGYWATGITLTWVPIAERINGEPYPGWHATVEYYDDGFADNDPEIGDVSTEGTLRTRYPVRNSKLHSGLTLAVSALLADARRLGVRFTNPVGKPQLYYRGDGEDPNYPPPDGWREMLTAEAARLGWVN